jgi:hypothetical protein
MSFYGWFVGLLDGLKDWFRRPAFVKPENVPWEDRKHWGHGHHFIHSTKCHKSRCRRASRQIGFKHK